MKGLRMPQMPRITVASAVLVSPVRSKAISNALGIVSIVIRRKPVLWSSKQRARKGKLEARLNWRPPPS